VIPVNSLQQLFPDPSPGSESPGATYPYTILDVFASNPLEGNALAVFPDARGLTTDEMQRTAREINLSETVFLFPPESDGDALLRIFTPQTELPFAGHPVLGAAFVVSVVLSTGSVRLETGLGPVPVEMTREGLRLTFGRMQQPVPTFEVYERADELLAALGVERSELPIEVYVNGPRHAFVMLRSAEELAALRPDFNALARHAGLGASCFTKAGSHWKTRMFAPSLGVNEDPATGSAAGPLAVHLARHGRIPFGVEIEIHQGDELGRPSVLFARAIGDLRTIERVEVGGAAVVVAQGAYLVRSARGRTEPPSRRQRGGEEDQ
jgi:trans-2,3-dihydro-3-hydroxyanthranilate isomerase